MSCQSARLSTTWWAWALVAAGLGVAAPAAAQPLPAAPSQLQATVQGSFVRFTWDAGSGATSYRIEAGSTPGASDLAALVVPGTELTYAQSVPIGAYYVRVRALNAVGASEPSNELALVVGACARPPDPPAALTAQATALVATLAWAPSPDATAFVIEAGSAPALTDLFEGDVGAALGLSAGVAPGTYFLRLRARNPCGTSGPSPETRLAVGMPDSPSGLIAAAVASSVSLAWNPPDGGSPGGYLIDVGSAPGLADLARLPVAGPSTVFVADGVAPGTYFVRVRALGPAGASGPSNEVSLTVLAGAPASATVTFSGVTVTAPLFGYEESGITVTPAAGLWEERTNYGNPAPYVGFTRIGSSNATASVSMASGAGFMRVSSVDLYSSVTRIPVVLTGLLGSHVVYSIGGTLPNTFGNFVTVPNPWSAAVVDRLVITLDDSSPSNPMGVDNMRFLR